MRVDGLQKLVAGLRELERIVPGEVDDLTATAIEEEVLPEARQHTPVGTGRSGSPGRLRDATRVTVRGRPALVNRKAYANTRHWGRRRRGVVIGVRFVWDAAREHADDVATRIGRGIDDLMQRHLPR